jgi:nucleoside-diphosphate-sugar epimerase
MQAFLGRIEEVSGSWRSLGGDAHLCFDEWRALARCRRGTGQFQLSWNVRPMQHQIVVQGTAGIMRLDLCAMLRTLRPRTHLPNAAERLWGGLRDCFEPLPQMIGNSFRFAAGSLRPFQGLHRLVAAFHQSLSNGGKLPIDLDDAVEVVRFTEQVARAAEDDVARRLRPSRMDERPYVVTGASGALGRAIAARLAERGERVRCFVRRPIDDELSRDRVEQALGDLGDRDAVREAIRDARVVIHAGAATAGDWDAQRAATVEGTRHVLDACLEHGVDKLVHISSMSVVRYIGQDDGDQVSEHTPLEPHPERRGAYTRAKLEAEWLVTTYVDQKGLPAVILRPGHIVGGGIPLITAAVARAIGGAWLVLGEGEVKVPLVRIEDVVEAVLEAADGDLRRGEIVQLIGETPTQNDVLARAGGGAPVLRVPERLLLVAGKMSEPCFAALGKRSPVSSYRLRSAIHGRGYRAANTPLLGWRPLHAAMEGVG